jgi:hypothetical protein
MARRWGCPLQQVTMHQRSAALHRQKALRAGRFAMLSQLDFFPQPERIAVRF